MNDAQIFFKEQKIPNEKQVELEGNSLDLSSINLFYSSNVEHDNENFWKQTDLEKNRALQHWRILLKMLI